MRTLSTTELLELWEQGYGRAPVERALLLLEAACPEMPSEALARLSIGRRDRLLMELREQTFGPQLAGLATCPGCGERLEIELDMAAVRAAGPAAPPEELSIQEGSYALALRLPDSLDLAAIARAPGVADARRLLLERCMLAVHAEDEGSGPLPAVGDVPATVIDTAIRSLAEADPLATVELELACPQCGCAWTALFDIVSFFWAELDAWAHRLLQDVHALASVYGWSEADILGMSPWRRQIYLEFLGA
jgi:hypothetical protein